MQQCGELVLEFLRCPLCGASLVFLDKGKLQCTKCGHIYSIGDDGIIDMLPDSLVSGRDRQWMKWYDENAGQYYRLFHRIIPIFTLGLETRARRKWAKLLELRKGDKIVIRGKKTNIEQTVESMQIEHKPIEVASAGDTIGLQVIDRAREGDEVFKIVEE